jgi:heme/copper-type cytochrome/quinol oxidase subunit 4
MIVLVVAAFWLAEGSNIDSKKLALVILGVALVKFMGIGFQFMELKKAHFAWKFLFSFFILVEVMLVWIVV